VELEISSQRLNKTVAGPFPEPDQSILHSVTPPTLRFNTDSAIDETWDGKLLGANGAKALPIFFST